LSLLPRLRQSSCVIPEALWIDRTGRPLAALHYARVEQILHGRLVTLMRADLERILFQALPRSVDVRFGHALEGIQLHRGGVEARLSSGDREHADVLIGADGIDSRVRGLVVGDSESAFRFLGLHLASFTFKDSAVREALEGRFMLMSVPERQVCFYPAQDGAIAALFTRRMPEPASSGSPAEALQEDYSDLGWIVPVALEHAHRSPRMYYGYVGEVKLSRWSFGRVALVGDACQAVSVVAGQGASLALHSAAVLAEELLETKPINRSLARYEERVRPLIERKQSASELLTRWLVPDAQWQIGLRNAAVRMAERRGMSWMLRSLVA
jgi:2-polyprenyl-6-methoxyphenol hydroxylase-like FAD-dependent oxidoreductase